MKIDHDIQSRELRDLVFDGWAEEETLDSFTAELASRARDGDELARKTLEELYGGWDG